MHLSSGLAYSYQVDAGFSLPPKGPLLAKNNSTIHRLYARSRPLRSTFTPCSVAGWATWLRARAHDGPQAHGQAARASEKGGASSSSHTRGRGTPAEPEADF